MIGNVNLVRDKILGDKILGISLFTHSVLIEHDYQFSYCLSVCIHVENYLMPIFISSDLSDEDFSLTFEDIEEDKYNELLRTSELSENISCITPEKYIGETITDIHVCESDDNEVLSFNILFSNSEVINLVSAEVRDREDGYSIYSPEEMVLVFNSAIEARKHNLIVYDFSTAI